MSYMSTISNEPSKALWLHIWWRSSFHNLTSNAAFVHWPLFLSFPDCIGTVKNNLHTDLLWPYMEEGEFDKFCCKSSTETTLVWTHASIMANKLYTHTHANTFCSTNLSTLQQQNFAILDLECFGSINPYGPALLAPPFNFLLSIVHRMQFPFGHRIC
ncbi:hypothetical protein BCR42DRAFT_211082 [Absidia repens]|uniref:Uncharacterized protein n=1 Tax=Absidia repens TaxID=90262 RepID=A0A1X2IQR6_9FUNG|nr:hypothetical protein BCR42DRAFT_211082 [Absidia repens]